MLVALVCLDILVSWTQISSKWTLANNLPSDFPVLGGRASLPPNDLGLKLFFFDHCFYHLLGLRTGLLQAPRIFLLFLISLSSHRYPTPTSSSLLTPLLFVFLTALYPLARLLYCAFCSSLWAHPGQELSFHFCLYYLAVCISAWWA